MCMYYLYCSQSQCFFYRAKKQQVKQKQNKILFPKSDIRLLTTVFSIFSTYILMD